MKTWHLIFLFVFGLLVGVVPTLVVLIKAPPNEATFRTAVLVYGLPGFLVCFPVCCIELAWLKKLESR